MAELVVETRLEEKGTLLMDDRLRVLLLGLQRGASLAAARAKAGLSAALVRRWRATMQDLHGSDPLQRKGRHLQPTSLARDLLEEWDHRKAAHQAHETPPLQVPLVAADGIVLLEGKLVAVRRRYDPFRGQVALPGGMVEYGETLEQAAVREVLEETGLETGVISLVGAYSDPNRDPRGHVISGVFELAPTGGVLAAASDAASVELLDLDALPEMAFDHGAILADFRRQHRK